MEWNFYFRVVAYSIVTTRQVLTVWHVACMCSDRPDRTKPITGFSLSCCQIKINVSVCLLYSCCKVIFYFLLWGSRSVSDPTGLLHLFLQLSSKAFLAIACQLSSKQLETQLGGIVDSAPNQLPPAIFKLTGEGIEPTSHEVSVAKSSVETASLASLRGHLQLGWDLE